jgi:glycerol-3-phosphate dehydrogenase subunit B
MSAQAVPETVDVLVIGGGMAGAIAALAARDAGATVLLVRRAPGATALSSGAFCAARDDGALTGEPLASRRGPLEGARRLAALHPEHPYAVLGAALERLPEALAFAARRLAPLVAPPLDRNRFVATPLGAAVPCALCQWTQAAGDLVAVRGTLAVVGFADHLAFDAGLVADGLRRLGRVGAPHAAEVELDLPPVGGGPIAMAHALARALEAPGAAEELGDRLRAVLPARATVALLPPVLGLSAQARVAERIAERAGLPIAEPLSDVPSVPGLRLDAALQEALAAAGVEVLTGSLSAPVRLDEPIELAGRVVEARSFVLATGRFLGGGILRDRGLREPVLGLPVLAAEGGQAGVHLADRPATTLTHRSRRADQPLLSAGIQVDGELRPLGEDGRPVHDRLFAAGAILGGHEQAVDGTGLGLAVLTGWLAGRAASGKVRT